jgi:23S rRNA pseudouridine1911/1915/1917 synthase
LGAALTILYRDDHLLVVSKPAGMLSVSSSDASGSTLVDALEEQGVRAIPVHRLDRDVSGAVLLALDEATQIELDLLFRARAVHKTYWALAQGRVRPETGAFKYPLIEEGSFARVSAVGKKSETRYRTLEELPSTTNVEIDLVTGRYNQIRVHFAHAGFPLVGERKYARGKDSPVRIRSRRVALHAWRLRFAHPTSGAEIEIEAPLEPDLVELLERARGGT